MTPERWQQVKDLFQSASERAPAERAAWLAAQCGEDLALRQEIESLLAVNEVSYDFMARPIVNRNPLAMAEPTAGLRSGRRIGPYQIESRIGAGGMGVVYRARDTRLDRPVALKMLPLDLTQDDKRVRRLRQEARAASALNHPNILTIYEISQAPPESGGAHFIAAEFVEGQTFRALLKKGALPLAQVFDLIIQTVGALQAAHAAGIVHRDLKPENLMLRPDGYVKVLDFGLAKLNERASDELAQTTKSSHEEFAAVETNPGSVLGTVNYMSPEQARGQEVDERTDIFSLGIVLYELVTGSEPFPGATSLEVLAALLHREPQPLTQYKPETPAALQRIVSRMLAKDRDQRYTRMAELLVDLKAAKQQWEQGAQSKLHTVSLSTKAHTLKPFIQRRHAVFAVCMLLVICVAALGLWFARGKPQAHFRTVAILPFKPLAASQRDEVLEIGIADTLITRLGRLKEVTVRPLSAVRRYTALDQDPVEAGRALEVEVVLAGSIQRVDDKVRVTAQLIKVADGKPLWTSQFDDRWNGILAMQDAIAQRFADDLQVTLGGAATGELARHDTSNAEAYQLFLMGRHHWNKRTPEGMRKSLDYYQQAIALDPNYALAYVGMADAYSTLASYHVMPSREAAGLARAAAEKALMFDPDLAEAHATLGKVYTEFYRDGILAEREFQRAIQLKPSYGNAHHWYSTLLGSHLGRFDEAIHEARRALELDQYSPVVSVQMGSVLYRARHYDEAIAQLHKTLDLDPKSVMSRYYLGLCYLAQEKLTEAQTEFLAGYKLAPKAPDLIALLACTTGRSGTTHEARRYQAELEVLSRQTYVPAFTRAVAYSGTGELDKVFAWLEQALAEGDPAVRGLKTDPLVDRLRTDARFADLMQRSTLATDDTASGIQP